LHGRPQVLASSKTGIEDFPGRDERLIERQYEQRSRFTDSLHCP
jgi:hypothetical protein